MLLFCSRYSSASVLSLLKETKADLTLYTLEDFLALFDGLGGWNDSSDAVESKSLSSVMILQKEESTNTIKWKKKWKQLDRLLMRMSNNPVDNMKMCQKRSWFEGSGWLNKGGNFFQKFCSGKFPLQNFGRRTVHFSTKKWWKSGKVEGKTALWTGPKRGSKEKSIRVRIEYLLFTTSNTTHSKINQEI